MALHVTCVVQQPRFWRETVNFENIMTQFIMDKKPTSIFFFFFTTTISQNGQMLIMVIKKNGQMPGIIEGKRRRKLAVNKSK